MKYFLIAGERSGDLHGSNLIKAIKKYDQDAEVVCWGGDMMAKAGGQIKVHYRVLAFMGILEVIKHLAKIKKYIKRCKQDIIDYNPDALVLIDYAGFNLRIAKFATDNGIPVHYYISPKIWAWNQKRAFKIKKYVDQMYCIMPFEKGFYRRYDINVHYVGNPLLDAIESYPYDQTFINQYQQDNRKKIAILPGSRKQEVSAIAKEVNFIIDKYKDSIILIAGVDNLSEEVYNHYHLDRDNVKLLFDKTYDILSISDVALVTSGTATLETALIGTPQLVCYKTSWVTYFFAKMVVKVSWISLVNLILNREAIQELIQSNFNKANIDQALNRLLTDESYVVKIKTDYEELKGRIGQQKPSELTARLILDCLKN